MKKTMKWIILSLFVLCGCMLTYLYTRPVNFEQLSIDIVLPLQGRNDRYCVPLRYQHSILSDVEIIGPQNMQSDHVIDPGYYVENAITEKASFFSCDSYVSMYMHIIEPMELHVSKISYKLNGKSKTAEIGDVHIKTVDSEPVEEVSAIMKDDSHTLMIQLKAPKEGVITKAELINQDCKAKITNLRKISDEEYSYDIVYEVDPDKELISTVAYEIELNGNKTTRYGQARMIFTTIGTAGADYVRTVTAY